VRSRDRDVVAQASVPSAEGGPGDGIGDLSGIAARLDLPAVLGVDVIQVSAIYPSPQHDAGKDVNQWEKP
jgi:glycosidase